MGVVVRQFIAMGWSLLIVRFQHLISWSRNPTPNVPDFGNPTPNVTDFRNPTPNVTDFRNQTPNVTDFRNPGPNVTDFRFQTQM